MGGNENDDITKLLLKPSAFGNEAGSLSIGHFDPSIETIEYLKTESKVLIIGAGGLGCDILKGLAYSGFKNLVIIDMDTIDLTNLNRQFLFRKKDIGNMKADVAKDRILELLPALNIESITKKIQDLPKSFYEQFTLVISGLDNIEARRWINSLLYSLVQFDSNQNIIPNSVIPLIDGGTEGMRGQVRVILPHITSCFECTLDSFQNNSSSKANSFPLCTIADKPRKPEHCIMFVFLSLQEDLDSGIEIKNQFLEIFGQDLKLNLDNVDHIDFIFAKAKERAKKFGLDGVTRSLTLGVVKNIIPAVASMNSLVASNCVLEAFKLESLCGPTLNNYVAYSASKGLYSSVQCFLKNESCLVCGSK